MLSHLIWTGYSPVHFLFGQSARGPSEILFLSSNLLRIFTVLTCFWITRLDSSIICDGRLSLKIFVTFQAVVSPNSLHRFQLHILLHGILWLDSPRKKSTAFLDWTCRFPLRRFISFRAGNKSTDVCLSCSSSLWTQSSLSRKIL